MNGRLYSSCSAGLPGTHGSTPTVLQALEGSCLVVVHTPGSVTFTHSSCITSMSLGTQAFHPQASLTKATLSDSLPACHIGSLLWITWLSPTCHTMASLLPFCATWYPPDVLPTSLSHPKTEDLGEEVETQQRWDVRYSLQGWITRIRDHTNNIVSVTTGCQFELRQKSVVTDCHSEASVSGPSVPTAS